jgi:3-oxoacyl-[acyl-carrier protein] reductase
MWGIAGGSCESHYSAAKAGLIGFTKSLAKELGPSNITVNCVAPGLIDTDMNSRLSASDIERIRLDTPLMRIGSPEDVARAILFLAEAEFITGQVLSVDGGYIL